MSAWMIRAGHGGVYAEDWLDKGKIGIGWDFGSKDIASMKREQIRATYLAEHPNESKNRVAAIVGQVYRFAHEMTQGQTVVMYDPASRLYHMASSPVIAFPRVMKMTPPIPVPFVGTHPHHAMRSSNPPKTPSAASRLFSPCRMRS